MSREDFLRSFAPFVDETTLFIPTKLSFELGQLVRFQVSLADGTIVLAGLGEASELLEGPAGPLGKSGVRFFIRNIDESSRTLRDELAARRRHAVGAGVGGVGVTTGDKARMTRTMGSLAPNEKPYPSSVTEPKAATPPEPPEPKAAAPSARAVFGSERRLSVRSETTQDFVPHFPGGPSPGTRRDEHDPLGEATLSAADPLEGERTLDDLQAGVLFRSESGPEPELPPTEPPAQGPPAELSPPAVQVLAAPPRVARGTRTARTAHVAREMRAGRGWRFGTTVLAAAAGLLVAFLFWMRVNRPHEPELPKSPVAAASVPPPEAEPMTRSMRPAEPEVVPVPVAPAPERPPASVPTDERSATPGHRCEARIESQPRGATVMLGQTTLGRTPLLRAAVPCGASITISHPRYLSATVALEGTPEAPVMVSARLSRPEAQLQLSSAPQGARFRVNGSKVGPGPRQVTVSRFESVRVEARLPGQRPWVRKIYLKEALTEVKAVFDAATPARRGHAR